MTTSKKTAYRNSEVPLLPLTPTYAKRLKWHVQIIGGDIVPVRKPGVSMPAAMFERARATSSMLSGTPAPTLDPQQVVAQEEPLIQTLAAVRELLVRVLTTPTAEQPDAQPDAKLPPAKPKRKYTRKQPTVVVTPVELKDRNWLTFKQAAALHPLSEQAFRRLARQAEQYLKDPKAGLPSNGFERCVIRVPHSRRVFLDGNQLDLWMASGRLGGGAA